MASVDATCSLSKEGSCLDRDCRILSFFLIPVTERSFLAHHSPLTPEVGAQQTRRFICLCLLPFTPGNTSVSPVLHMHVLASRGEVERTRKTRGYWSHAMLNISFPRTSQVLIAQPHKPGMDRTCLRSSKTWMSEPPGTVMVRRIRGGCIHDRIPEGNVGYSTSWEHMAHTRATKKIRSIVA